MYNYELSNQMTIDNSMYGHQILDNIEMTEIKRKYDSTK